MTRQGFLRAASGIIILATLFATLTLFGMLVQRERAELERRTQAEAQQIATHLRIGMMSAPEPPLSHLGTWWLSQGKPLDQEDWRNDAQLFLINASGLRQALWVGSDGVERWSAMPRSAPITKPVRPDDAIGRLPPDTAVTISTGGQPVYSLCHRGKNKRGISTCRARSGPLP